MKPDDVARTPCGTLNLIAPEQLKPGYDHRVDVWSLGLIAYMLLTTKFMFPSHEHLKDGSWSLTNFNCSVELLKFISDTV